MWGFAQPFYDSSGLVMSGLLLPMLGTGVEGGGWESIVDLADESGLGSPERMLASGFVIAQAST